ncbi:HlyC/CorC family transporter [bacterium]|nr:HlyC/CorC family transporter [bacterium]
MDIDIWIQLLLFLVLILMSAFFSGSESAYFSLSEADLFKLRGSDNGPRAHQRVVQLMSSPRRLLLGILIGNTVVNVAAATLATLIIHKYWPHGPLAFTAEIVGVTLILLIASEVTPKILALKQTTRFALAVSLPLLVVIKVLTPMTFLFDQITRMLARIFRVRGELPFADAEELKTLLEVGEENGALDENEREMIQSVFDFHDTIVREVMVPRTDIVQVEKDTSIDEVLLLVKELGHSRIPVYEEQVDQIIGILHVKDLLPFMRGAKAMPALSALVRKAYFIPESKMIDELLKDFQQERIHMAIVVDEYGGTAGLVTLEDIIEEIVGEIRDEYDKELPLIVQLGKDSWRVDGKIGINELNEALELAIPEDEEYDSLGGFILSFLGHIPEADEKASYANVLMIVESVESQRIQTVKIVRKVTTTASEKI